MNKNNRTTSNMIYKKRGSIVSVRVNKRSLWKGKPEKSLCKSLPNTGGRNNQGRITCRAIANKHKKKYRMIDFKRNLSTERAIVKRIEYDPNRTAFIALVEYESSKIKKYIIAQDGLKVGSVIESGIDSSYNNIANCCTLLKIPIGTLISMVETQPGRGASVARAAGTFVKLVSKRTGYAILSLPSGNTIQVSLDCKAVIGKVSNVNHFNTVIGHAGHNRKRGRKSKVRGIAMNPIDHANGGRTCGGKIFSNFKGNMVKGYKTVRSKKKNKKNYYLIL